MAAKKKQTKATASARATATQRPWYADQYRELFADVCSFLTRGKHRITKSELAAFLGTDLATLEALEAGLVNPTGRLVHQILHLCELQRQHRATTTKRTKRNTK